MRKIEVNVLDYNELDNLINDNFFPESRKYEFIANEEMGNDSEKLFKNIKKEFKSYEESDLNEFLEGDVEYRTLYGLTELCRRDIIPEGNYLITVCW